MRTVPLKLLRHPVHLLSLGFGSGCAPKAPGTMGTPLMEMAPEAMKQDLVANIVNPKRLGRPEEFALLVESILRNDYLNGENIRLDGALRFPPK